MASSRAAESRNAEGATTLRDAPRSARRIRKLRPGVFRPSRILAVLLFAAIGIFLGFVIWQLRPLDVQLKLNPSQWVVAVAAWSAVIGWMTNALVTVRNSVKQHTINTLLQSRLSTAYMTKAEDLNEDLADGAGGFKVITVEQLAAGDSVIANAIYFLNHFEFIAVGIRQGDLDENLIKESIGGQVRRFFDSAKAVIDKHSESDARTFEHLKWLRARWTEGSRASLVESGLVVTVCVLTLLLMTWGTPSLLGRVAESGVIQVNKTQVESSDANGGRSVPRVDRRRPTAVEGENPSRQEQSFLWDPTVLAMTAGLAIVTAGIGVGLFGRTCAEHRPRPLCC